MATLYCRRSKIVFFNAEISFQENVLPMKINVKIFVQILTMWHIVSCKLSKINNIYCICLKQVSAALVHRQKETKLLAWPKLNTVQPPNTYIVKVSRWLKKERLKCTLVSREHGHLLAFLWSYWIGWLMTLYFLLRRFPPPPSPRSHFFSVRKVGGFQYASLGKPLWWIYLTEFFSPGTAPFVVDSSDGPYF